MRAVSLIGMPGSGKSTVGRYLARQLDWRFVDTDAEIEHQVGRPVSAIFAESGERTFRDLEEAFIATLLSSSGPPIVLSTGGGAVLREANRAVLRAAGAVVYLRAVADELVRRLRHDRQRPLLQVADPLKKLRELYRERDPLYRQTAHFTVETGRPSIPTLANMIIMQLELGGFLDPTRTPRTTG